ncbi:phage distal tail protein [Streptomyces albogriseolus]|uniref:phage distal tail protein n=1 Tax=Streptomyces albogriseolus TaxID=1887 RepID=UPI0036957C67
MAQQALGQVQWGNLVFGPGTPYTVTAVDGLDDLPDIRSEDIERPGQHGDYSGPDYTGARVVQMKLGLRGQSPDDLRALSLALRAATQPQRQPAPLQFLDQDVLVYAKVRKRSIPYDAEYLWRIGDAALEFYCPDPYLYGLVEKTERTTAYSPAVGRTYPRVYAGTSSLTLNANPSFETTIAPWTGADGAVVERVNTLAQAGTWSARITPNGTGLYPRMDSELMTVTAGVSYRARGWLRCATARDVALNVNWYDAGQNYLSTSSDTRAVAAGTWTEFSAAYTAPAGATYAQLAPTVPDTPPATDVMHVDDVRLEVDQATGTRSYGAAGASGRIIATNEGASDAFPVLRIDGPVANPAVEQVTTGGSLIIDATLQAGEHLVIDTRSRAVLLMGSSPRRSWVRGGSSWPVLQPGDNELAFRGSALPGDPGQTSLLTVSWRDTSL